MSTPDVPAASASSPSSAAPVALVTGASSGFGLLASVELARRGHRVFASMRDLGRQAGVIAAARAAGVQVETLALDVTDAASVSRAVAEIEARAGGVDVLVNNAGYGLGGFFEDVSDAELREIFETNFFGACAVMRAVLPGMRARRRGRVIQISSISGRVCKPAMGSYAATKWALEGLSESLRLELKPFGIDVVIVEPGTFKTDIFTRNRRTAARTSDPSSPYHALSQRLEALIGKVVDKAADPAEVARVIADAATAPAPRLRYLVGKDAFGQAALKAALPYKMFERAVLKLTGLDSVATP